MHELQHNLSLLQNQLNTLLARIQDNDAKQHRFHLLESELLALNSLNELIRQTLAGAQGTFDLDAGGLCLVDGSHELRRILQDDGVDPEAMPGIQLIGQKSQLKQLLENTTRAYLGPFRADAAAWLFAPAEHPATGSMAVLPLVRRGRLLGSLNLASREPDRFSEGMATDFLDRLAQILAVCLENTVNFELLRRASLRDTLTGVNNRRFFDQRLEEEIARVMRSGECLSCLFLDIDHFKRINDSYGHQTGDLALVAVAHCIRTQLRNNDVLARYGGEEFVALLTVAAESDAREVAERIRRKVESAEIKHGGGKHIPVALSIGIATLEPNRLPHRGIQPASELLALADLALYRAKNGGRNRVEDGGLVGVHPAGDRAERHPPLVSAVNPPVLPVGLR
ncbi:MAG: sensor domain-containing diguanylate cyclase [Methylococcaceae bacterium]|nr:sensor domain-containing diguanylate cyclase [Methylococcaceae bacterium]